MKSIDKIENLLRTQNIIGKKQITLLFLIASSITFALILIESTLRLSEIYQYRKDKNFEFYKEIYSDERDKPYLFGHKPNVKVRVVNDDADFTFETNSTGLREQKDYKDLKNSVVFLGDSVIEGSPVDNKDSMDSIFENKTNIVSLNFGLGSANTVQEYYWLREKYQPQYNSKLIILGFTLNDFEQNGFQRYFDPKVGNWRLYNYTSKHTNPGNYINKLKIVNLISGAITKVRASNKVYGSYTTVTQEQKDQTNTYIQKIDEFAKSISASFIVVIFPARDQLATDYSTQPRAQEALVEILKKDNIEYIDLYDYLKEKKQQYPQMVLYHDDLHFTKYGYELVGNHLAIQIPKIFPKMFKK